MKIFTTGLCKQEITELYSVFVEVMTACVGTPYSERNVVSCETDL